MGRKVYQDCGFEVRERSCGFVVIHTITGRVQQTYGSLQDAKKWFFGIGL